MQGRQQEKDPDGEAADESPGSRRGVIIREHKAGPLGAGVGRGDSLRACEVTPDLLTRFGSGRGGATPGG